MLLQMLMLFEGEYNLVNAEHNLKDQLHGPNRLCLLTQFDDMAKAWTLASKGVHLR